MGQSEWEGSLGENGYVYMYDWVPLLPTWNYNIIVKQLHFDIKKLKQTTQKLKKNKNAFTKTSRPTNIWSVLDYGHLGLIKLIYEIIHHTEGLYFFVKVVVSQLLSVQLFATPWTAAHQASLSFTISWSLLKLMSIEKVTFSNHCILCHLLLLLPS